MQFSREASLPKSPNIKKLGGQQILQPFTQQQVIMNTRPYY